MIDSTAIIDEGAIIPDDCLVRPFCHIMAGAEIGANCRLGQNVVLLNGSKIGNSCKIQNNVSLFTGVECEDDVFIGPSVVFTNVINPRAFIERKSEYKKTLVKKGASIGAGSVIVCGNTIGEYAMVGAACLVNKDVKAHALVVGNPMRQIAWVSHAGHKLIFDENNIAICPETGAKYQLINDELNSI